MSLRDLCNISHFSTKHAVVNIQQGRHTCMSLDCDIYSINWTQKKTVLFIRKQVVYNVNTKIWSTVQTQLKRLPIKDECQTFLYLCRITCIPNKPPH